MRKIIIAFDGKHFSEAALEFAAFLNDKQPLLITGVFLNSVDYRDMIGAGTVGLGGPVWIPKLEENDRKAMDNNVQRFENYCTKKGLEYRVHKDDEIFALKELINETRYSDLLIISSETFYINLGQSQPNDYMEKVLHQSECPVLAIPEHFEMPESVVLSYDGKTASVFAIKQFAYLFPEFISLETVLIHVSDEEKDIPERDRVSELVSRHFENLSFQTLQHHEPKKYFQDWIANRKNTILVSGAFGRSGLSESIKKSFVFDIIKEHKVPVFITHR